MQAVQRLGTLRPRDDVFFFILIDFLVQILFFGLFLFVVYQASLEDEQNKVKDAVDAAGVSDITELTDDLTRLAPMKLNQLNELIQKAGGAEEAMKLLERASQEGGAKASIDRLDKLRRLEGADKPSCLVDASTRQAKSLMTVLATGRSITIVEGTPDLAAMAGRLGIGVGQSFDSGSFERKFRPLLTEKPECRYFIKFQERTELVAPRRAAGSIFYLMVR